MADHADYPVGYMSPPKHTRFQKGNSGNPKGRPRQAETIPTQLHRVLNRKVTVAGMDRAIPISEALIYKLRELAISGDRRVYDLMRTILEDTMPPEADPDSAESIRKEIGDRLKALGIDLDKEQGINDQEQ